MMRNPALLIFNDSPEVVSFSGFTMVNQSF